ncbi:MAG TPA: hypothetical protein VG759_29405 [Candidatus Angelobacter sp.]|jgi:hypothetical protein|nr:hypothetical protein [Candidatus Angelobacter sp.]
MVHRLFENFLDSIECYRAAERYWEELFVDVTRSTGQTGEWRRWLSQAYADGTRFELDGNPIFDGYSPKLNRAFRIMQHLPVGDQLEIAAWLKTYEEEYSDLPREELVINLSLSQESVQLARELLIKWTTPGTPLDEMRSFIRERIESSD